MWVFLISILILSPFIGAVNLNISEILNPDSLAYKIFFDLRIPRVLFAFFSGVILALSGLLFQTLFRNALMTPYTLGISSGAVLGAGIAIEKDRDSALNYLESRIKEMGVALKETSAKKQEIMTSLEQGKKEMNRLVSASPTNKQ